MGLCMFLGGFGVDEVGKESQINTGISGAFLGMYDFGKCPILFANSFPLYDESILIPVIH